MSDCEKVSVEIREMCLEDLALVYALGEELFTADRWTNLYRTWDEYEVLHNYMSDPETSLVAEIDGVVVGFALGTLIEKPRSAWTYGYLLWFGVHDDYRKRGVARRLLRRLTELCIEAGARMMLVDTDAENIEAIDFFKKSGFGHPQGHVYMSKNLTGDPAYERHRAEEKRK